MAGELESLTFAQNFKIASGLTFLNYYRNFRVRQWGIPQVHLDFLQAMLTSSQMEMEKGMAIRGATRKRRGRVDHVYAQNYVSGSHLFKANQIVSPLG